MDPLGYDAPRQHPNSGDLSAVHLVLDQALRWFEVVDGSQRLYTGDVDALDVFTEPGL